jgi:acyl-CoA hydrolase
MIRPLDTSLTRTLALGSELPLRHRFMVIDEPLHGNLRFGLLLEVLDKLAEETALGYTRLTWPETRVVTAAIDSILVRHVPDVTRDLVLHARINHVGRTSMEVGIRVDQAGEQPIHIASCYFTMVARSTDGSEKSLPLPPLEYVDDKERHRAQKATEKRERYRREQSARFEPPSRDEYDMLLGLHQAQERPGFTGLLAGRLVTDSWERMYPEMENVPKTIFGGFLVRRAYELSSICAGLVAPDRPVIASVDRINFFHPVRVGDSLHFTSRVVYTGNCHVSVEASIERISRDRTTKALSNSCLFTFVNFDSEMMHRPVSPIYPVTYAEDARYLDAYRRSQTFEPPPV